MPVGSAPRSTVRMHSREIGPIAAATTKPSPNPSATMCMAGFSQGQEGRMCFHRDARPPALPDDVVRALPPLAGGAAAEHLELASADGTAFSVALAEAAQPRDPAVVILPDVRGLYRFYAELAERFAQAGHHAVALDSFGRTAGTGEREDEWDVYDGAPHSFFDRKQDQFAEASADAWRRTLAFLDEVGAGTRA